MIAVIDYGAGNLFSVGNALDFLKIPYVITDQKDRIRQAQGVILPGVGAFPDAMGKLAQKDLVPLLHEQAGQKPFLGICLGMQVLFSQGKEFRETEGLSLFPGTVEKLAAPGLKIPHMGWNRLRLGVPCPLTQHLPRDPYVYFVHSYCANTDPRYVAAWTDYGSPLPALVYDGAYCYGAQFHPEKSGDTGLQMLRNFAALCG